MQKKAIIFDCFGVIISNVMGNWFREHIGTSQEDKEEFLRLARLQDIGKLSEHDVNAELAKHVGSTAEIVEKEIQNYFKLNNELVIDIKKLKTEGYKLALLTNASHEFFENKVFVQCPWFKELFDVIVISSIIKMVKPEPEIYNYTLEKLGMVAVDVLFIDDSEKNVKGAKDVGIDSIIFKNVEDLRKDLEKFNINI